MGIRGSHGGTLIYISSSSVKTSKENGEEVSFVSFPRRKVQGRWEDVVHPSQELRERIAEVVNREIRKEIIKDLELPEIVVQSMSLFQCSPKRQ